MRTNVYVDAFNLYYGCLKKTPYRWLNIHALCERLLPQNDIQSIKYFTAKVSARPNDPDQPARQNAYLRALETLPNVEIVFGHFLTHIIKMPKAVSLGEPQEYVEVVKTEEKGSDVNLATYLLHDAHQNRFDVAVVISNDSDLLMPIKIVRGEIGKKVGVLNPQKNPSRAILPHIDFIKQIRAGALKDSQFPDQLFDERGQFNRPRSWY